MTAEIDAMVRAALDAGAAILAVYDTDYAIETKDDRSPLTEADRQAHRVIQKGLAPVGLPILSEEGRQLPYETRKGWDRFFLVDPLDGTKEFIKRNGEFTVNIAVIERGRPTAGVIYVPVQDLLYVASPSAGALRVEGCRGANAEPDVSSLLEKGLPLPLTPRADRPYTVVGSRSHGSPELDAFVARLQETRGDIAFESAGSSLKFCRVAEGSADVYPRTGPTCEWDTAAGQAIAEHAGCSVTEFESGRPLRYNKENLLNPWFVVRRA